VANWPQLTLPVIIDATVPRTAMVLVLALFIGLKWQAAVMVSGDQLLTAPL
jgi:hypothetical protein